MNDKPSLWWRFCHRMRGGNIGTLKRWSIEERRKRLKEEGFRESDPNVIATLSDKELALFQSQYTEGSRQFILAEYEWQRRLTTQQIKAGYRYALMGLLGTILGYSLPHIGEFLQLLLKKIEG